MFKTLSLSAAVAAALAFAAPTYAQEVVGVIKSYDDGTRVLVLEDGTQLILSESITAKQYRAGTKVKYIVEDRNGKRYITKIIEAD